MKPKKHAGGRPPIKINWEEFDKLCLIQCTELEIACWFDIDIKTVRRAVEREKKMSFGQYWALKAGKGKISIRRKQFELAQSGNIPMLIWWGKNNMGQAERVEEKSTIDQTTRTDSRETEALIDLVHKIVDDLRQCQTSSSTPSSAPELGLLPPSSPLQ